MNAKVGGIPWELQNTPCIDTGTMVVGLAFYGKGRASRSYIGWASTTDPRLVKYYTYSYVWELGTTQ